MQATSILPKPISELEVSDAFKEMSLRHDFRTLQDILNWPTSVLLMHKDFTYHIYQELRKYLQNKELLYLLQIN